MTERTAAQRVSAAIMRRINARTFVYEENLDSLEALRREWEDLDAKRSQHPARVVRREGWAWRQIEIIKEINALTGANEVLRRRNDEDALILAGGRDGKE